MHSVIFGDFSALFKDPTYKTDFFSKIGNRACKFTILFFYVFGSKQHGLLCQDKYSPLSLMIPNSDPTLFQNSQSCGAAILGTANELITLEVTAKQYYLKPNVSISLVEELNQLKPLKRI